jgi:excisionase family DNA binding protein
MNLDNGKERCYTSLNGGEKTAAEEGVVAIEAKERNPVFGPEWLTVPQVAELRNVSRQAIQEAIKDGRLPAQEIFTRGNRTFYLVRREVAVEWDEQVARSGRGARKRKLPKTEKPARHELILAPT